MINLTRVVTSQKSQRTERLLERRMDEGSLKQELGDSWRLHAVTLAKEFSTKY